jgi:hypothetical protein
MANPRTTDGNVNWQRIFQPPAYLTVSGRREGISPGFLKVYTFGPTFPGGE